MPGSAIASSGDRHRAQQEIPVTEQALSFNQEEIDLLEFALWEAKRKHSDNRAFQKLWSKVRQHVSDEHDLMTGIDVFNN